MRPTIKLLAFLGAPAYCVAVDASLIKPQLEQFCFRCHGDAVQTAGINLAKLITQQPLVRDTEMWRRVMEVLENRKMPPGGATSAFRITASLRFAVARSGGQPSRLLSNR